MSKIGLSQEQIIELICHIDDKDLIDESSSQYDTVFMYIKNKKDNR